MGFLEAVGRASPAILSNIGQMKQMAIQDQQEKREAIKFDYLQKKVAEEEADSNKLIPVSLLAGTQLGQKYPTAFNTFLEHSRREGALVKNELAGEEMIRKKDLRGILAGMNLTNEAGQAMMKGIYQDAKMRYMTLLEQKNSGKLKKPEELEELKQAEAEYLGQASLMDENFQKAQIARQKALYEQQIKPPNVQDIQVGRNKVQMEWDPATQTRKVVGGGPMDAPEKPVLKETADGKLVWVNPPSQQGIAATPGGTVQGQPQPMATEVPGVTVKVPGKTDDQRIVGALTQKLGRAPTDQEVLDEDLARKQAVEQAKLDVKSKEIDVASLADAVANGQDSTSSIKGSMGNPVATKVKTAVLANHPKFDFAKSDANYKWQVSSVNQRVISQVEGVLPRIQALANQAGALENANFNTINRAWNAVNKEFGRPEVTNFEANRNAIVQEVNTALSGSSTSSDLRVKIELENLKVSRSPQQLMGAINNLNEALLSRLDTQLSIPYPMEVVRGEKTIEQYRAEQREKYSLKNQLGKAAGNPVKNMSDEELKSLFPGFAGGQ